MYILWLAKSALFATHRSTCMLCGEAATYGNVLAGRSDTFLDYMYVSVPLCSCFAYLSFNPDGSVPSAWGFETSQEMELIMAMYSCVDIGALT